MSFPTIVAVGIHAGNYYGRKSRASRAGIFDFELRPITNKNNCTTYFKWGFDSARSWVMGPKADAHTVNYLSLFSSLTRNQR